MVSKATPLETLRPAFASTHKSSPDELGE
jgi:hypothetical protein